MRRRILVLTIVLTVALGLQAGAAASLTASAARLGGGSVAVTSCDAGGFVFHHVINSSGRIATVTVTGIHASCAGGTLRVTLVNGATSVGSGSVVLPSSAFTGTADVTISPLPLSTGVTAVYAAIEGP